MQVASCPTLTSSQAVAAQARKMRPGAYIVSHKPPAGIGGIHPRAESFELHVYYLTYTLLRSSGVPQSVVYPMQASGVISTPF